MRITIVYKNMYMKGRPTLSCLTGVCHRLPPNSDGKGRLFSGASVHVKCDERNAGLYAVNLSSNSLFKRWFSMCNNRHRVVDYRAKFDSNFRFLDSEFLKFDAGSSSRLRTGCPPLVSNARRFVTVPQSTMGGVPVAVHPILKPTSSRSSICYLYCTTTVPADGEGKPADLVPNLEKLGKKIIEAAKKRDVMAGSVPLKKVVTLLQVLHHQGFTSHHMTSILSQQVQFLFDLNNLTSLTELLLSHGIPHRSIILFLENVPFIEENASLKQMKVSVDDSINYLRMIGFKESDISSFLTVEPRIFLNNSTILSSVISQLKGLFSSADTLCVLNNSPNVFCDPWEETRKKFDYVYFVMCYKQAAMLNSFMFQHDLEHIQDRHQFLLRAGFFHRVREKDDPKINPNPPLGDVVDTSDVVFARKFGDFCLEEYMVYLNMREVEREVEREEENDFSDASDEEDEVEEEVEKIDKKKNRQLKRK